MKKLFAILLSIALLGTVSACSNVTPNAFGVPWTATNVPSEYTEYAVEFAKYSDDITIKGTVIAKGVQSVYLRKCDELNDDGSLRYPDCIRMTTEREVTYLATDEYGAELNVTRDKNGVIVKDNRGKTDRQTDEVIFSMASGTLMHTKYASSVRVYESDPSLNYACEGFYGNGLRVVQYVQDNELASADFGKIVKDENGADKVKHTYKFKAKHVPTTTYDNAQLLLVTRYADAFKEKWSGSFTVVSLADVCYSGGDLAEATFSISVAEKRSGPTVPDIYDDSSITGSNSLAQVNAEGEKRIPCLHTTFSRTGTSAASKGPKIYADFAATRQVTEGAELANVLVRYEQYVPFLNINTLGTYEYVNSLTLTYAARNPR